MKRVLSQIFVFLLISTAHAANVTGSMEIYGLKDGVVEGGLCRIKITLTNNGSTECHGYSGILFSNAETEAALLSTWCNDITIPAGETFEWVYCDLHSTSMKWHAVGIFECTDDNMRTTLGDEKITFSEERIGSQDYYDNSNGLIYSYTDESTCYLYGYDGSYDTKLTIPEVVNGHQVRGIGYKALSGYTNLQSLVLPSSITKIGSMAFSDCYNLTTLDIPDGVTELGYSSLSNCSRLISVKLPADLEVIYSYAFRGCSSLESIHIPAKVKEIDNDILNGCSRLKTITIAEDNTIFDSRNQCNAIINTANNTLMIGCLGSTIPSGVTTIGYDSFRGLNITSIDIPNTVKEIKQSAFYNSGLTSLRLPSTLESIGSHAFANCNKLKEVFLEKIDYEYESTLFQNCGNLEKVYSLDTEPTAINGDIFNNYDYNTQTTSFTTATLYVPEGTKEKYASLGGWRRFGSKIMEFDVTGVSTLKAQPSTFDVYDLHGHKVRSKIASTDELPKGIYIVNQKKMVIR